MNDTPDIRYEETQYGFNYGSAEVTRLFSGKTQGWVTIGVRTPKHKGNQQLQIYVTKTGKIRIHDHQGEWQPPKR